MYKYFNKKIDSEMIEPFVKKAKLKTKIIISDKFNLNKKIRLTLDYQEDLKLMKILINKFDETCDTKVILKYLKSNKDISKINYFRENFWKNNQNKKNQFNLSLITMNKNKIKKPLVIFELANNHMGKISHAINIIKDYYNLSKKFNDKINFAIKISVPE